MNYKVTYNNPWDWEIEKTEEDLIIAESFRIVSRLTEAKQFLIKKVDEYSKDLRQVKSEIMDIRIADFNTDNF